MLNTFLTIPCESCSNLFTQAAPNQHYCSPTCRDRAYRHRSRERAPGKLSNSRAHARKLGRYVKILPAPTENELIEECIYYRELDTRQYIWVGKLPRPDFRPPSGLGMEPTPDGKAYFIYHDTPLNFPEPQQQLTAKEILDRINNK
jgi:hypothetical protein